MDALKRFEALSEGDKQIILDRHRDINVEHDWWDCVYEAFTEDMKAIGIGVDTMYFSGFWSQGDGACFEGRVDDWRLFLTSLGYTDELMVQHFADNASFSVSHSGHYYHENCTRFDAEFYLPDQYVDEEHFLEYYGFGEELRDAALVAVLSKFDGRKLEDEFTEAFKGHMRDLYRRLENQYEYLTSDEAVLETLHANDMLDQIIYEYTEEGGTV